MKLLLLGANGQVGHELRRSLASLGDVLAATRDGRLSDGGSCEVADLDNPPSLAALVERIAPDVVVNAAAWTAVDLAEAEREASFRANAEAPRVLAEACAGHGARFVHYSTDYVFDGRGTRPWREDDPTSPLGVYGASKLAGEEAIRASGADHAILRTAWVYAPRGRNFLLTMLRLGAEHERLRVVADQVGTPTSAALVADATAQVLAHPARASGTWHLTAGGQTSWHGFAEAIFAGAVERGLLPRAPAVDAIPAADYPTPAARPGYSVLDTTRLQERFEIRLPEWQDGLGRVLDRIAAGA
ncbi:MAG: dTDP-4-dehydrorhamnose reductase [Thermomonas sp.]